MSDHKSGLVPLKDLYARTTRELVESLKGNPLPPEDVGSELIRRTIEDVSLENAARGDKSTSMRVPQSLEHCCVLSREPEQKGLRWESWTVFPILPALVCAGIASDSYSPDRSSS